MRTSLGVISRHRQATHSDGDTHIQSSNPRLTFSFLSSHVDKISKTTTPRSGRTSTSPRRRLLGLHLRLLKELLLRNSRVITDNPRLSSNTGSTASPLLNSTASLLPSSSTGNLLLSTSSSTGSPLSSSRGTSTAPYPRSSRCRRLRKKRRWQRARRLRCRRRVGWALDGARALGDNRKALDLACPCPASLGSPSHPLLGNRNRARSCLG